MTSKFAFSTRLAQFCLFSVLLTAAQTAWAVAAGSVYFVQGDVRIRSADGTVRVAQKGDTVNVGDRLVTGNPGNAQLRMVDDAFIAVLQNTDMAISNYQFSAASDDSKDNAVLSLLRGTMRVFTGALSKVHKERFVMRSASATIGIRGSGNVLHYSPALGTINHTIEGAHSVQGLDAQGQPIGPIFVTRPGDTVQVLPGQPPVRIPTPSIIREATQQPRPQAQQDKNSKSTSGDSSPRANAAPDKALTTATSTTETAAVTTSAPTTLTITATTPTGTLLNLTTATQSAPSGQPLPLTTGPSTLLGDQAAAAAAATAVAANSLNTLLAANPAVSDQTLPSAITPAASATSAAQTAVSSAQALSVSAAVSAATASAAASSTLAATATSQATVANATFTANGIFADAILAVPAHNTLNTALATLTSSNTAVQNALATINSAATTLASNQVSASTQATAMNAAIASANSALTSLTNLLGTAALANLATALGELSIAQTAASLANAAAAQTRIFEAAGNIPGAQAQLAIALQQQQIAVNALTAAGTVISGIASANAAKTVAGVSTDTSGTAYGFANAAISAAGSVQVAAAQTVATTPGTPANLVQTNAVTVATNAPLTQYNNPAVAAPPNGFLHLFLGSKPAGGGSEFLVGNVINTKPGSNYVLDGNKNLVDIRAADKISARGYNYTDLTTDTSVAGPARFVSFTGGTAQDTFKAPDNSIYLGRWQGGNINIFSNTAGTVLAEPAIALGNNSVHWLVAEALPVNFSQKLTGQSTYALIGSTRPTDTFGNVGILNSATLSADFSAQTAQASVNLSFSGTRSLTLNAVTPAVPLDINGGFQSTTGLSNFAPTITCTGTGCVVPIPGGGSSTGGYLGGFNGGFAGTNASVGGFGYQFIANLGSVAANTAQGDIIQGVAAFSSATAPFVGTNPVAANTGNFRTLAFYPISGTANGTASTSFLGVESSPVPTANTSLIQDASGNLVRFIGQDWNVFNAATSTPCLNLAPCLTTAGAATTGTIFSMANGTIGNSGSNFNANGDFVNAAGTEKYNSGAGITFGRYQGGTVTVMDPVSGNALLTPLGINSVNWLTQERPSVLATSLTGAYHYLPKVATAPADSLGNVGTLYGASLNVSFGTQSVEAGVRLGINGQEIRAYAPGIALASNFNFSVDTSNGLRVSCFGANCVPLPVGMTQPGNTNSGYFGRISGGFATNTASDAFFRYTFNTIYNPTVAVGAIGGIPSGLTGTQAANTIANNYINGFVGFSQGPAITPSSIGPQTLVSYGFINGTQLQGAQQNYSSFESVTSFAGPGGNLSSITPLPSRPGGDSITIGGTTTVNATPTSVPGGTGITFGGYQGQNFYSLPTVTGQALTVSGQDYTGTFINRPVIGGLSWISGPSIWPIFISAVLTGSVTYTGFIASAPGDLTGSSYAVAGSVTPTTSTVSATLNANFTNQSANSTLNITLPANTALGGTSTRTWIANASNIGLDDGGGFNAYSSGGAGTLAHRTLSTLTLNGSTAFGGIQGQLSGALLNGAMLSYAFQGSDPLNAGKQEGVAGVIGFYNPSYSITQPTGSSLPATVVDPLAPYHILLQALGTVNGLDATGIAPNVPNSTVSAAANRNEYLTNAQISAVSPTRTKFNSQNQLVQFDQRVVVVTANPCAPSICQPNTNEIPGIFSIIPTASGGPATGTAVATVADSGSDLVTGLRWGRYNTNVGTAAVIDRVTGAVLNPAIVLGSPSHYLIGSVQSGTPTLPTTGTATYTLVGNTSPTDNLGNVGTLTSATLSADFTNQKVNAAVVATVNGTTWNASTQVGGVPIIAGIAFEARKDLGGTGNLNVSCSGGSCINLSANLAGRLTGAFVGATGQGAGVAYSLFNGTVSPVSVTGTTINGVAAFRR